MKPIKLFVGCAPNGEDAESLMVLEYSLKKNTTGPVDIEYMKISEDPDNFWAGWKTEQWATPFSGYRWGIPAACNYEGRAIYCDSDFVFLSDLRELWETKIEPGKVVVAKGGGQGWRYCSCLWDCEAAKDHVLPIERLRSLPESHRRMMGYFSQHQTIVQPYEGSWNCVDGENLKIEDIDALHYSDMGTQLHQKYALKRLDDQGLTHWFDGDLYEHPRNDLQKLFDDYYKEAIDDGFTVEQYCPPEEEWVGIIKESQKNYGRGAHQVHQWAKAR